MPNPPLSWCLHVTSSGSVQKILEQGLQPRIGPLSECIEDRPAIFMFPSWADLMDANWLFGDDIWPYETEPALLAVDVRGIDLHVYVGYEVQTYSPISADRIRVLAPGERDWQQARSVFMQLGGRAARHDAQAAIACADARLPFSR